jgi:hypothetical protein
MPDDSDFDGLDDATLNNRLRRERDSSEDE